MAADHPKGGADYDRFVRKHDRYYALSGAGDIISGVAHVDPGLSPFGPPAPDGLGELNARMLMRAAERVTVRERWNIGEPYADEPVATVTVVARHPLGLSREYLTSPPAGSPRPAGRPGPAGRLPGSSVSRRAPTRHRPQAAWKMAPARFSLSRSQGAATGRGCGT